MNGPTAAEIAAVLERSDERELFLQRILAAERTGYERGRQAGRVEGCADAEARLEASWRELAVPVSRRVPLPKIGWERRLRAAEAESRRQAFQHMADCRRRLDAGAIRTLRGAPLSRSSMAVVHDCDLPVRPRIASQA